MRAAKWCVYRILKILDTGRPLPVGEGLIAEILTDVDLEVTHRELRRALDYLQSKEYVEIVKPKDGTHWLCKLTAKAIDYLEDSDIVEQGIARPGV